MKYLLTLLVLALVPTSHAQVVRADYSTSVDLAAQYLDGQGQCLAGLEAAFVYYHERPNSSILRLRNFIQGDVCARPGGNLLKVEGLPLRSYQHSTAWRYYKMQFDGMDNCGALHFSGTTMYQEELLRVTFVDYSANRCRGVVPPANFVVTEYQSQEYFNRYYFLAPTPEQAHYHIFD